MTQTATAAPPAVSPNRRRPRSQGGGIAGQPRPNTAPPAAQPPQAPPPPELQAQPVQAPVQVPVQAPVAAPAAKRPPFDFNKPIGDRARYNALLQQFRKELESLLAGRLPTDLFIQTCSNAWIHTRGIQLCTGKSILNAIAQAAGMGLMCNGLGGDGWLAAFRNRNEPEGHLECTLLVGYRGLIRLAYLNPAVVAIKGACVRRGDHFLYDLGTNGFIEHHWDLGGNRESQPIVGAWAAAETRGATERIIVVMDEAKIRSFRNPENDKDSLMWTNHPDIGYAKAPLRQLCKLLPQNPQLAMAMTLEDRFDMGETAGDLSPLAGVIPEQTRTQALSENMQTKAK